MRGMMMRASILARAALVVGLLGGCSPQPSTTPLSTQAVPTATPSASVASVLEITWEPFVRLGDMLDMAHGGLGWVALGACRPGSCPSATVWHSADLEAWETIELPRSGDIAPVSLSANSDGYLVAAYDFDDVGDWGDAFLQVWRSSSGRSWERVGELRLGACNIENCPGVRGVGLAPNGAILVGAVNEGDDGSEDVGPYVSDDGVTWRETTIATFSNGVELGEIFVQGVESTPTDLFVYGWASPLSCGASCASIMTVWSTTDGENWAEEQGFGTGVGGLSIASDGVRRVVAVTNCPSSSDCSTDVWSGLRSTVWTNVAPALDLGNPEVVWTGDAFVLVGVRGDVVRGDQRFVGYASADGITWTEVPGDALGGPGSCDRTWLAGGAGTVLFGVPECAAWKGIVQQAR